MSAGAATATTLHDSSGLVLWTTEPSYLHSPRANRKIATIKLTNTSQNLHRGSSSGACIPPETPFGGADLGAFLSFPPTTTGAAFSLVTPLSREWVEAAMEGEPDSLVGCEARVVEEVMVELAAVPVAMSVVAVTVMGGEAMDTGRWPRSVHRVM
jgi:hypothetical protein